MIDSDAGAGSSCGHGQRAVTGRNRVYSPGDPLIFRKRRIVWHMGMTIDKDRDWRGAPWCTSTRNATLLVPTYL
jgi:hypothetical protein